MASMVGVGLELLVGCGQEAAEENTNIQRSTECRSFLTACAYSEC